MQVVYIHKGDNKLVEIVCRDLITIKQQNYWRLKSISDRLVIPINAHFNYDFKQVNLICLLLNNNNIIN